MTLILSGTNGLSDIDGSAATPAIRGTDANTGIFFGADIIGFAEGGAEVARFNADAQFVAAAGTASLPVITTTGDVNTGIFFPAADTIAFAEGGAEAMRIDSSGNVGIGTSSPSTYGSTQKILAVQGSSGSVAGYIATVSSDATRSVGMYSGLSSSDTPSLIYVNALRFGSSTTTDGVTGYSEKMRIDSSGNLLLNTTSNSLSANLFVNGVIGAQTTFGPMFVSNENNTDNVGRGSFNFQRGGVLVGQIVTTNSTCAYNSVSDYRLKENITPITGALNKVAQLNPVTYKWKSNGLDGQGFIAHELQAVVPDCVTGEKDAVDADGNPKYQGIDTSFLVATLTAAIQEQQALITDLTARITALENK
jgi:hypothetical protein